MSFGFSVGDILAVIELANKVRKDFAGAPNQFRAISDEVRSLSIVLQDVDIFLAEHDTTETQRKNLSDIAHSCRGVLTETQATLDRYVDLGSREKSIGKSAIRAWKRLTWEPDDIRDLRSRTAANIILLNSFIEGYTRDSVAKVVKRQSQQENQEILDWLSPTDYAAQQSDFIRRRQPGTGQWLLSSPEYQRWVATEGELLFCPGIPGAGKTILMSIVVDDLFDTFGADSSVGICYLYCNFRRLDEQQLDELLLNLVKQLAQSRSSLPRDVRDLYARHIQRRTRPSIVESSTTLQSVVMEFSRVFVVVDALDECLASDGCRTRLISELLELRSKTGANIMATSRFLPEVSERFSEYVTKEIYASNDDIGTYLDGNLAHLPGFVRGNLSLQADIKESIMKSVNGMFLLAQLHLDSLRGKRSPKDVRKSLGKLAQGSKAYDIAYHDAMARIQSQLVDQTELAMQALAWITYAERPLTTTELQHALGVELDEREFDEDNLPDVQELISNCCGLVTVDKETDIIRLVHYTTHEYFKRNQDQWFLSAQFDITRTCITYLSYQVFEGGMCTSDSEFEKRLSSYPLYDYASRYWGHHARSASDSQISLDFLAMDPNINASSQALLAKKRWPEDSDYSQRVPRQTIGLHLAAFFGLYETVMIILDDQNLDKTNSKKRTALSYAAQQGHEPVVRLLLAKGAEVDSGSEQLTDIGWTPLMYAISRGHESVLRLLLAKGAKVNSQSKDGASPLSLAAWRGDESTVRLLLVGGAKIDSESKTGFTMLSLATDAGSESIVRLLLENGVDVNSKDFDGGTALSMAAIDGHEHIAKLLLDKGADIEVKTNRGRTPLSLAAGKGWESVARLLLDKGAEIESNSRNSQTPLSWAAAGGHEAITRLLLAKGAQVNLKDKGSVLPLTCATFGGHASIVRLLVDHGADVDSKAGTGCTPLSLAAWWARESVVRLLLEKGTDPRVTNDTGIPALFFAIKGGHNGTFSALLADERVDAGAKDYYGSTAVSVAARCGRVEITKQLVALPTVNVAYEDRFGRTPLWWARTQGHTLIIEVLLEALKHQGVDVAAEKLPLQTPCDFTGFFYRVCDVCMARTGNRYYRCTTCSSGDFAICVQCRSVGAQCMVESHALSYFEAGQRKT